MPNNNLFTPNPTGTVSLTCGLASARVALALGQAQQIRIKNIDTTNTAYVEFGGSTVAATVPNGAAKGSMPIGPGETVGVTVPIGTGFAAGICTAGTPTLYFTPGYGN